MRLRHQSRRRPRTISFASIAAVLIAFLPFPAIPRTHHVPRHRHHRPLGQHYTGFKVQGRASTFGYPAESPGQTADGGTTTRPCIALRDDATLDHWFEVTILGRHAKLLQCDWGPASWTGRSIDITGNGASALGFNQATFPTGVEAVAREIR